MVVSAKCILPHTAFMSSFVSTVSSDPTGPVKVCSDAVINAGAVVLFVVVGADEMVGVCVVGVEVWRGMKKVEPEQRNAPQPQLYRHPIRPLHHSPGYP